MDKKIVVLGGGTGQSSLLKSLKRFPFKISAVVCVSDDGKSTGKLRRDFNVPAVGDVRRVIVALSETEKIVEKLVDYRFKGNNSFSGHTIGNIILTALCDIEGSLSDGIKSISSLLNLKGKVIPLTNEAPILCAEMEDKNIIVGESNITNYNKKINRVFYKHSPKVVVDVLEEIKKTDAIILSMGSIYTSIIPNLLCKEVIETIDKTECKIIYICNIMTQPGESDNFKVSDHVNLLNSYLGKRKIDIVFANTGNIDESAVLKYKTKEQKDPVILDVENIKCEIIGKDFVAIKDNYIRHDELKLGNEIFNYLTNKK